MQALVDRNSEATDTGGFVSLSTVVFVFGNDVREERLSGNFQFQMIKAKSLFIDFKVNLEICISIVF